MTWQKVVAKLAMKAGGAFIAGAAGLAANWAFGKLTGGLLSKEDVEVDPSDVVETTAENVAEKVEEAADNAEEVKEAAEEVIEDFVET